MRNGNVVAIDGVVMLNCRAGVWFVVSDYLMPKEVKIDPLGGAAAFGAAEGGAVEVARSCEVVDGKGDVKRGEGQGGLRSCSSDSKANPFMPGRAAHEGVVERRRLPGYCGGGGSCCWRRKPLS